MFSQADDERAQLTAHSLKSNSGRSSNASRVKSSHTNNNRDVVVVDMGRDEDDDVQIGGDVLEYSESPIH